MKTTSNLPDLTEAWHMSLRARGKSPNTIRSYLETVRQFVEFLTEHGQLVDAEAMTSRHVDAYLTHILETRSASTARLRYRSLQQFFRYLVIEGDITESPMVRMTSPPADEKVVPVVPEADLRQLLKVCASRDFTDRRDLALFMFFLDTGARLGEVVGLQVGDVDIEGGVT